MTSSILVRFLKKPYICEDKFRRGGLEVSGVDVQVGRELRGLRAGEGAEQISGAAAGRRGRVVHDECENGLRSPSRMKKKV